jgi:DNA-binding LytR/AlgR family response regulator
MKIAIVDDDRFIHPITKQFLSQWAEDNRILVYYDFFSNGNEFLEKVEKGERYSIVLMDIFMPKLSGVETAFRLRKFDPVTILIFLTSSKDHMPDTFPCHTFDYIMKPVQKSRLARTLDDALHVLPKVEHYLAIQVNRQKLHISYSAIQYISSDANYCIVTTAHGDYRTRMSFRQIETLLSNEPRFLCINRGVLVNLDSVESMDNGECLLKDQIVLPLHSKKKNELCEAFANYRIVHNG